MTDLTPAEQAAADAMGALCVPPGDIEEIAPAVVAAVRETLFRDVKERMRLAHEIALGSPMINTRQALELVDHALNAQMETREEWAIRVVKEPGGTYWYHHESTGEEPEQDLADVLELLAESRDLTGQPVEHGPVSIVKRTVKESPWETVKTIEEQP